MLSEIELKALRIIQNDMIVQGRLPTIRELMIRTGRSRTGVYYVLQRLAMQGYIEWSRQEPEKIRLIQPWGSQLKLRMEYE